ncbi:Ig-like domain-containing protein [Clostridium sp.]|uniref:Ig-like domain-containing protein n=1 Tax=Clostridium sp. TaxID=1506 RepID=UPI00284121DE|nr:Ig-like domain-containing protein [Clostridium sp.]MDR3593933.1 Ig-like domain-containing protein [Clostridium sp.]
MKGYLRKGSSIFIAFMLMVAQFIALPQVAFASTNLTWTDITGSGNFRDVTGVTVDSSGNAYVTDSNHESIQKLSGGTWTDITGGASFLGLNGVAVDNSGNVYVIDNGNSAEIWELSNSGTWTDITGSVTFGELNGIAVDKNGDVYVTDSNDGKVWMKDRNGWIDITNGHTFNYLGGIAVADNFDVYVTDISGNSIWKLSNGGGGWTNITGSEIFKGPKGIEVDSYSNLYVTDMFDGKIKELPDGETVWVDITGTESFNYPVGIAVDSSYNIYVADSGECPQRIMKGALPINLTADRTTVSSGESVTFTSDSFPGELVACFKDGIYMGAGPLAALTSAPVPWSFIGNSITSDATVTFRMYDDSVIAAITGGAAPNWNTPYLTEVNVVFKALTSSETTPSAVTVESVNSLDDITVANGTNKSNIGLPETIDVTLSNESTTSAAVTWDNGNPAYDGDTAGTYTFTGTLTLPDGVANPNNYKASVKVIVQAGNNNETTPAAVTIEGTPKVGDTLTAQLKDATGNNYTTSAAVTYEWYRLDNSDSEFVNEIGTGKTYKLTGSDLNKYIGVRVTCGKYSFEYVIGRILPLSSGSSSSSSSSSHHNDSSTTDTSTNTDTNKNDNNNSTKIGWTQDTTGTWYYVKDRGTKTTGWKLIDNKWYFFNDNTGAMVRGWYKSEAGDWTYDQKDTLGQWFHLDADGKLTTGWYKDTDGNWYYLCDGSDYGALGVMETGWKYINSNWYYFNDNGAMASNTVVDGYTLGSDGALVE